MIRQSDRKRKGIMLGATSYLNPEDPASIGPEGAGKIACGAPLIRAPEWPVYAEWSDTLCCSSIRTLGRRYADVPCIHRDTS